MASCTGDDSLVFLPLDHRYSLQEPFLVTTQHAVDIGLVGWNDKLWKQSIATTNSRPSKKQQNRSFRLKEQQRPSTTAPSVSKATTALVDDSSGRWYRAYEPTAAGFYFYNEFLGLSQWEVPSEAYEDDATVQYYTGATPIEHPAEEQGPVLRTADLVTVTPLDKNMAWTDDQADDTSHAVAELQTLDANLIPANELFSPEKKGDLRPDVEKYWIARYSLFSRWSEGVRLNEKSLFSVTPEVLARHHADMLSGYDVVVDAFCGCGGNAIQLAMTSKLVIACDIDVEQLQMARWNAHLYGVADRIQFEHVDFFSAAHTFEADAVFLSPPWCAVVPS